MSLAYLKIHYVSGLSYKLVIGESLRTTTACGRLGPDWARRCTEDPDLVTCESCLDALVRDAARELRESRMSIEEILERRG